MNPPHSNVIEMQPSRLSALEARLLPLFLSGTVGVIAAAFAVILFFTYYHRHVPQVQDVTVLSSVDKDPKHIDFPYSKEGAPQEKLDFNFSIVYNPGESTVFTVIPDDCVDAFDINGRIVELEGDAFKNRCAWRDGFAIDLKPYLKPGANPVHIQIINHLGPTGLKFEPAE